MRILWSKLCDWNVVAFAEFGTPGWQTLVRACRALNVILLNLHRVVQKFLMPNEAGYPVEVKLVNRRSCKALSFGI